MDKPAGYRPPLPYNAQDIDRAAVAAHQENLPLTTTLVLSGELGGHSAQLPQGHIASAAQETAEGRIQSFAPVQDHHHLGFQDGALVFFAANWQYKKAPLSKEYAEKFLTEWGTSVLCMLS